MGLYATLPKTSANFKVCIGKEGRDGRTDGRNEGCQGRISREEQGRETETGRDRERTGLGKSKGKGQGSEQDWERGGRGGKEKGKGRKGKGLGLIPSFFIPISRPFAIQLTTLHVRYIYIYVYIHI
jgi:hypothetical protein